MADAINREVYEWLSVDEKIQLVQDIWEDVAKTPGAVELTPAQLEEAERRLLEHEQDPDDVVGWEQMLRRLRRAP